MKKILLSLLLLGSCLCYGQSKIKLIIGVPVTLKHTETAIDSGVLIKVNNYCVFQENNMLQYRVSVYESESACNKNLDNIYIADRDTSNVLFIPKNIRMPFTNNDYTTKTSRDLAGDKFKEYLESKYGIGNILLKYD